MKTIERLEKSKGFWFLIIISIVFFLLRWPSLFEPNWYGDEGVYQAVAMLINSGEKLYSGAWENKPPLLIILYALLNSDQFLLRLLSMFFGLVSVWFFFLTSKKLFKSSRLAAFISTAVYVLIFGTRLIEGNIANAENFMILPIMITAYLMVSTDMWKKILRYKTYFIAGLILSFAFLIKIVAIFDFLAFSSFLLFNQGASLKHKITDKVFPFTLGFILPIFLTISYFFVTNNFKDFMDAFIIGNVGYVNIENQLLVPQGLLIFKSLTLSLGIGIIFLLRKRLGKEALFISIWFAFALFNVFFAGRPYEHYLITLLPSFALLIGLIIDNKKLRIPILIYLLVGTFFVYFFFNLKFEFIPYYKNFASFFIGTKSIEEYYAFFDKNTPRDYEISRYIKSKTDDKDSIFIWGNNAQVYKLTNKNPITRYTAAYHMTYFPTGIEEAEKAINEKEPKLIIIMPNVSPIPYDLSRYDEKINIKDAIIYEKIF